MSVDWKKPLRTRYGIRVELVHGSGALPQRRVCEMKLPDGRGVLFTVDEAGRHDTHFGDGPYDVMNVEEPKKTGGPLADVLLPSPEKAWQNVRPTPAPVDWAKPIQTRAGRKARVLCTDLKGKSPVVVAVEYPRQEVLYLASEGGCCRPGSVGLDIVNVPQRHPHADVIKAWADGAEVQFREGPGFDWRTIDRPVFTPELEYRVKP